MNEFELIEAIQAVVANLNTNFISLMTVISGYLVVAYIAGDKLSRSQSAIVTLLFLVLAVLVIVTQYYLMLEASELYSRLIAVEPEWPVQIRTAGAYVLMAVWVSIVLACLKFMHDKRPKKTKKI